MYQFHLPDPTTLGSCGEPRKNMELAKQRVFILDPEVIRLPPIRQGPSNDYVPQTIAKSRKLSVSSVSSSNQSNYHQSRSASPAMSSYSPHNRAITDCRLPMQNRHSRYSPYPEPCQFNNRCLSCLERGDSILVAPGKPCPHCGTLTLNHEVPTRTSHKKRHDRILFSRQTSFTTFPSQVAKSDREAGRRYDQTLVFSLLENELLSLNPSLPQTARPRQRHPQGGLKELKGNNVSGDIKKYSNIDPLRYGKIDNLEAAVWVIRDSTTIIDDVIKEREELRNDAEKLLKEGADSERVWRFLLDRIVQDDWSERVRKSKRKRGGCDLVPPSQMNTLLR